MKIENKLERLRNGDIFEDLIQAWKRLGRLVYNDAATDPESLERATGLLYMTHYLTAGATLAMELNDPDYPYFDRWADRSYSWGIDSPDGLYSFACIRGDSTYRIFGKRGTAHQFDIEVHSPHFANAPNYLRTGNLGFVDIDTEPDGSVEIVLSPEPPPEDKKFNWIQLAPDAESVCVRQFFYDWENEQKAELSIEKIDAKYPPPPEKPEVIVDKAELLIKWLDEAGTFWDEVIRTFMKEPNTVTFLNPKESDWGGHGGLSYGMGSIEIGQNEAALLEVKPPDCHFWGFQLGSIYWESMDWWRRQSSLNGFQAKCDSDGVFRCVISSQDPAVHNWLDSAGFSQLTIMGRWLHARDFPQPQIKVIPFEEIDKYLPENTQRISLDERSEIIRRRNLAVQKILGL